MFTKSGLNISFVSKVINISRKTQEDGKCSILGMTPVYWNISLLMP